MNQMDRDRPPVTPRRMRRIQRPRPPRHNGNRNPPVNLDNATNLGYTWVGFSKRNLNLMGGVEEFVALNPSLSTFGGANGLQGLQRLSCRLDPNQKRTTTATWQHLFEAMPNLKILHLEARCQLEGEWEDEQLRQLLPALESKRCAFQESLEILRLPFSCNEHQDAEGKKKHTAIAQRMMLETLPNFTNLRNLVVTSGLLGNSELLAIANTITRMEEQNDIMSELSPLAPRSKTFNENLCCIKNHGFALDGPVGSQWRKQEKSSTTDLRQALLVFLRAFPGFYDLGGSILYRHRPGLTIGLIRRDMPPPHGRFLDVEGQLLLNHAGRYRFGGGKNSDGVTVNDFDSDGSVPMNLWPMVLERAHRGSWRVYAPPKMSLAALNALRDATGLYDLLRNCEPILRHLVTTHRSLPSVALAEPEPVAIEYDTGAPLRDRALSDK